MKRFGLPASERVKKRNDFEQIYTSGRTIFSSDKKLRAAFTVEKKTEKAVVKIAAAVGKKSGSAVWRNRVKRLLRESYRQNKEILAAACLERELLIKIVFSPNLISQKRNRVLKLKDLMPDVIDILLKIKSTLQ